MLTISELASRSGLPAQVVRYYARIGLIRPAGERDNGYREFDPRDAPLQTRMEAALETWEQMPDRAPDGDCICHLIEAVGAGDDRRCISQSGAGEP